MTSRNTATEVRALIFLATLGSFSARGALAAERDPAATRAAASARQGSTASPSESITNKALTNQPLPNPSNLPSVETLMQMVPGTPSAAGAPAVTAIPAEPKTLTLKDAVDRAVQASTEILKSRNDVDLSGEQLLQSYAQFLPSVGVGGTYGYQRGTFDLTTAVPTAVFDRSVALGYQVGATLNLFNGLNDFAAWRAARAQDRVSGFNLERARQEIILDVTQSFLQAVLDQDVVRIAAENFSLSQQRERLLTEQTKLGVKNLADLFRQQAQTSADETNFLTSIAKARSDQFLLLQRIRLDESQNYVLQKPTDLVEAYDSRFVDEGALVKEALERRADLKSAESLVDRSGWNVTQARSAYFPRLDLGFNYYGTGHNLLEHTVGGFDAVPATQEGMGHQLGEYTYYTIGLNLTWSLFDRLNTRYSVARARIAADNYTIDRDDRQLQVVSEVRRALGDYRASFGQLESSRKGLQAAQKAYEVTSGRYEVGSANFIDLVTAQTNLMQAQSTRVQAVTNFQLQSNQLQYALGTL